MMTGHKSVRCSSSILNPINNISYRTSTHFSPLNKFNIASGLTLKQEHSASTFFPPETFAPELETSPREKAPFKPGILKNWPYPDEDVRPVPIFDAKVPKAKRKEFMPVLNMVMSKKEFSNSP